MDSSEGKGRLMDQAKAVRLQRRTKLNSPGNHTNEVPQTQTGSTIKTDCTLNASEAEYRATLDAMKDSVHVVDRNLRLVLINKKLREWSQKNNLDVSNAVGRTLLEFFPFLSDSVKEKYAKVFDEGMVVNSEDSYSVGGKEIIAEVRRFPIFEAGRVVRVVTSIRDVTKHKRAEEALRESESRYRAVVDNAGEGIVVVQDGRLQFFNPYVEAAFGRTQEELKSRPFIQFVHPEDRDWVMDIHIRRFRGEEVPPVYEFRVIDINGDTRWAENNGLLIEWCGRPATLNFVRDITDRKRAEEALRISELRIRSLIEHTTDAVFCYEYDPPISTDLPTEEQVKLLYDGVLVECNDVCARTYGVQRAEEVIGKRLTELFGTTPGSLDKLFTQLIEGDYQTVDAEGVEKLENGTERCYLNNGHGVVENGKLIRVWGTFRDVTEQRKAAEALRRSEQVFRTYFELGLMGMAVISPDKRWIYVNNNLCDMLGYSREELLRTSWADLTHPEDLGADVNQFEEVIAGEIDGYSMDKRFIRKDSQVVHTSLSVACVRREDGSVEHFIAHIHDITDRKKAEQELRQHADVLLESQTVAKLGHYVLDTRTGYWEGSQILNEIFGFGEDYPKTINGWQQRLHPDEQHEMSEYLLKTVLEEGQPFDREYRIVRLSDNQTRWVHGLGRLEFSEEGKPIRMIGTIQDITERQKDREAIRLSEEKYRRVVEDQTEFIARWLPGGIRTFVNESYCRYFGISEEQAVGTSCWPQVADSFHRTLGENIKSLTPENPVSTDEIQVIRQDGTTGWNLWTTRALFNEHGELMEYQAVGRDITKRKMAEEELARQRYYLARAQEIGNVGTWELDLAINNLVWTDENYRIFGLPLGTELTYETFLNCVHPEDREYVETKWKAAISGEPYDIEHRILADGKVKWVREKADLEFDEQGSCVRGIGFTQDITERKKARNAIEDRLQFERLLSGISSRFVNLPAPEIDRAIEDGLGHVGRFFGVDRVSIGQFVGIEKRPQTTHSWLAEGCTWHSGPEVVDACYPNIAARLKNEGKVAYEKPDDIPESWTQERQFAEATGIKAGLIVALRVGGMVIGAIGVNSLNAERSWPPETAERLRLVGDIFANALERKRVEDALIESEAKFKSLAEQSPNMIFINKGGKVVYANERCEKVLGYKREQLCQPGFDFHCLIAPESQDLIQEYFSRHMSGEEVEPYDYTLISRDGRRIEAINSSRLIKYEGETAILGIVTDITKRKRAEEELRESEKRYRLLVDCASDSIFLSDLNGRFIDVNPAACNSLGRTREELLNLSASDIGLDWPKTKATSFLNDLADGESVTIEGTQQRKNKTIFPVEINLTKINADGNKVILAVARDITQRRRSEESLRKRAEAALREDKVHISGIDIEWDHDKGICTFEKLPVIMMWIDTTLAALMAGVQTMVGTERFGLALQGEGRKSVEDDWQVISQFPDFRKGFEAIANIAAVAGWGDWKLIEIDSENQQCLFRVWNSWEGLYQKSLGVCWGSGVLAGKLAGYCSMLFKANCWTDQSAFIAKGDDFDEFQVHTSTRSIEKEIDNLLVTDKATRADMAVALQNLRNEMSIRRKVEEELKKSEERMALALQGAQLGTWDWNVQTGETTFDRRWAEMLGYKLEEIEPHVSTWEKLVHPDDMPRIQEILNAHLEGKTDFYETEHRMRHKCGEWIWVLDKGRVIDRDADGKPLRAAGTHLDITDHKRAEQRILENRAQLKSLASKLSLTEERERHRLATDLHDQIGQSLVISKIKLDQLRESTDSELTAALGEVCRYLEQIIQDTRLLTFDLSSPILYELGFEAAVAEWLTDEVRNKHGIHTEFDDDGLPKPLDEDIRALLFRNVRELLINIVKHAKAGKVKVSLRKVDKNVNVTVEDDGVGFDPVEVKTRAAQNAEFGLFSIRERLEQLGGHLEIESGPGQGSRITMRAPLKSESNS